MATALVNANKPVKPPSTDPTPEAPNSPWERLKQVPNVWKNVVLPKVASTMDQEREADFCGSKGSKRIEGCQRRFWPDMEEKLIAEFTNLWAKELKVKQYWFHTHAVQLMGELHLDVDSKFSPGWFDR